MPKDKRAESDLARIARKIGMPPEVVTDVERQIDRYITDYETGIRKHLGKRKPKPAS